MGLYHYNDERIGEIDHGFKILGTFEDLFSKESLIGESFLLTMGDNHIHAELTEKILQKGGNIPSLFHPTAVVSRFAEISPIGVYISAFSHIQADTIIGQGTVILAGVNISHTNTIGKYCFIAGGATVGAYTIVEDYVFVGQGALSISAKVKTIGHHAYIGAKALVTKAVPANVTVAGHPARIIGTK